MSPNEARTVSRKTVKVYLNRQQEAFLDKVTKATGMSYSSYFIHLFVNDLRELNLIQEEVHSGQKVSHHSRKNAD